MKSVAALGLLSVLVVVIPQYQALRHACYYPSWAKYRNGPAFFDTSLLDPNVCSHVIYSFVGIDQDGNISLMDPWNDIGDEWSEGQIQKLNKLKTKNPNLKTMIACGGYTFGSRIFSIVANNPDKRINFANSAAAFVKQYGYDGFDLDWEYPGVGSGSSPTDKDAFSELLRVFRETFDEEGLLFTAATSSSISSVDISYDVPVLSENLDFINLMAYDLHGSWEAYTGHVAPLHYGDYLDNLPQIGNTLHVEAVVDNFIAKGADPQKINLGIVAYGRTFTLANPSVNGFGAAATGPGNAGSFVAEAGMLGYHEICYEQKQNKWVNYYDEQQAVPYAVKGNQWVGYEDTQSIASKLDFVKSRNLGGTVLWSIDTDDFAGTCSGKKFPLQSLVKETIGN